MAIYLVDTETTDRRPPLEVIELAWLRVKPGEDLAGISDSIERSGHFQFDSEYCQRFRPAKPSTYGALAVHHILPHELEGCPPSSSLALPADMTYMIAHNVDFDWEAVGSPKVKRICTDAMARHVWSDATGYSQVALTYLIGAPTEHTRDKVRRAHGALADVHMNADLLYAILEKRPDILTWSQLWEFSEECRIPRTCPMKRYEGIPLEDLETGFIRWCLGLYDLNPYYRKGLERVMDKRFPERSVDEFEDEHDDEDDDSAF
jgi:exodeoxyribonuclease X